MPRVILVCLILLTACCAQADIRAIPIRPKAPPAPTVTVEKDQVRMTVSLAKATYGFREPIVFTVALKNLSDRVVRLAEPYRDWTMFMAVTQISGTDPMPSMMSGSYPPPPPDYGWDFLSGEEKRYEFEINITYSGRLPVGQYELLVTYYTPREVKNTWRGKAVIGPLEFTITAASEAAAAEGDAFWALFWAHESNPKYDAIMARVSEMAKASATGPYSELAGYVEARYLYLRKDKEGYYRAIRKYIADHPKVPHYSERARGDLARSLLWDARYDEALSVLESCANGWQRSDLQRQIELKKQKQK